MTLSPEQEKRLKDLGDEIDKTDKNNEIACRHLYAQLELLRIDYTDQVTMQFNRCLMMHYLRCCSPTSPNSFRPSPMQTTLATEKDWRIPGLGALFVRKYLFDVALLHDSASGS